MATGLSRSPKRARTDADQVEFWNAWDEFAAAWRAARGRAAQETPDGLTHSQFRLLCAVAESPDGRCGQLAEQVGVAAPTVTRMLSGLEAAGFVTRTPSTEDRRGVCVHLTAAGREALRAKREVVARKRQTLYDWLSPVERRQATELFRRLADELDVL
jgi:DNA-binding MarR family transcriptional regulator